MANELEGPSTGKSWRIKPEEVKLSLEDILSRLFQYSNIADTATHINSKMEYVVQIPLKYRQAFEDGELSMNQNMKTNVMWPTLYEERENGKRKFVAPLPIKERERLMGNPFSDLATSYHNLYMQHAVHQLADKMEQTYRAVERIERGQLDDRIGLLSSGRQMIVLALMDDDVDRENELTQGRQQISVAQRQILQTFKTRASGFIVVPESEWSRFWKLIAHSDFLKDRDREFDELQEYYSLFLQSTQMLAASYAVFGKVDKAEYVYTSAIDELEAVDLSKVQSIKNIHPGAKNLFCWHAEEYLENEKRNCLEEAKEYDTAEIEVSGDKLLEAIKNE